MVARRLCRRKGRCWRRRDAIIRLIDACAGCGVRASDITGVATKPSVQGSTTERALAVHPSAWQTAVLGAPRQISSVHARVLAVPGSRDHRTARHQGVVLKGCGGDGLARDSDRDDLAGTRLRDTDLFNNVHAVGGRPVVGVELPHREPGRVQARRQV